MYELVVASDFSKTPGPRSPEEGPYSGELFLESLLVPRFKEARDAKEVLTVNLDGTAGYASSFLEAAFGGLAREFGSGAVEKTIKIVSNEEPYLVDDVRRYIKDANG